MVIELRLLLGRQNRADLRAHVLPELLHPGALIFARTRLVVPETLDLRCMVLEDRVDLISLLRGEVERLAQVPETIAHRPTPPSGRGRRWIPFARRRGRSFIRGAQRGQERRRQGRGEQADAEHRFHGILREKSGLRVALESDARP